MALKMDNFNGENKVVGTDCDAAQIALAIKNSSVLKANSMTFARKLAGNTDLDIEKLHKDYSIFDKFPFLEFVLKVLEHWIGRYAGDAKLSVVLNVLEQDCQDEKSGEAVRLLCDLPCAKWNEMNLTWTNLSPGFQAKLHQTLKDNTDYSDEVIEGMKPTLSRNTLINLMMGRRPEPPQGNLEAMQVNLC